MYIDIAIVALRKHNGLIIEYENYFLVLRWQQFNWTGLYYVASNGSMNANYKDPRVNCSWPTAYQCTVL
jgi:hypothetical protein